MAFQKVVNADSFVLNKQHSVQVRGCKHFRQQHTVRSSFLTGSSGRQCLASGEPRQLVGAEGLAHASRWAAAGTCQASSPPAQHCHGLLSFVSHSFNLKL